MEREAVNAIVRMMGELKEANAEMRASLSALHISVEGMRDTQSSLQVSVEEVRHSNSTMRESISALAESMDAPSRQVEEEDCWNWPITELYVRPWPPALLTSNQRAALSKELVEAAKDGSTGEVRRLLRLGASTRYREEERGWSAMHFAAQFGHAAALRALLDGGAPVNATTNIGNTPLHVAAWNGSGACTEALLAAGAAINARGVNGQTPLHHAVRNSEETTIRALLAAGADTAIRDNNAKAAREYATRDNLRAMLPPPDSPQPSGLLTGKKGFVSAQFR